MLHTNNPIAKHKAGLLNLAEELGNISKACKVMGMSRDTFYRYQELVPQGGDMARLFRTLFYTALASFCSYTNGAR